MNERKDKLFTNIKSRKYRAKYYGEWVMVKNLLGNMRGTKKRITTMQYIHFAGPCKFLYACIKIRQQSWKINMLLMPDVLVKCPFLFLYQISRQFLTRFRYAVSHCRWDKPYGYSVSLMKHFVFKWIIEISKTVHRPIPNWLHSTKEGVIQPITCVTYKYWLAL